ncbi:MAG TPA: PIG-L family deacetylase [Propylenella sp.]|nr:PIG-L family deacetylase [Propylenella sp.]
MCVGAHPDDLALSIGGSILLWRKSAAVRLLTLFGRSRWCLPRYRHGVSELSRERAAEEDRWRSAARVGGAVGDLPDSICRGLSAKEEVAGRRVEPALLAAAAEAIAAFARPFRPDFTVLPLALGRHIDHIIVRDAGIASPRGLGRLVFYEDLPYAWRRPDIQRTARVIGASLPVTVNVSRVLERKLALLSLYRSQLTFAHRWKVRAHAVDIAAGRGAAERLWSARDGHKLTVNLGCD